MDTKKLKHIERSICPGIFYVIEMKGCSYSDRTEKWRKHATRKLKHRQPDKTQSKTKYKSSLHIKGLKQIAIPYPRMMDDWSPNQWMEEAVRMPSTTNCYRSHITFGASSIQETFNNIHCSIFFYIYTFWHIALAGFFLGGCKEVFIVMPYFLPPAAPHSTFLIHWDSS